MSNNNYQRGAAFERKVVELLRSCGYSASRTAGSHGLYDVVAFNSFWTLIVQCKVGKSARFTNEDRNELIGHAMGHGAFPILATKDERGGVKLEHLKGMLNPRQRKEAAHDVDLLLKGSGGELGANGSEPAAVPLIHPKGVGDAGECGGTTYFDPGAHEPARS